MAAASTLGLGSECRNAASGHVKPISVKSDNKERVSNSVTRLKIKGLTVPQISSILDRSENDSRLHEAEEKARTLTKELTQMEMCKIELSDPVIWLEEQLEIMGSKLSSAGLYEETLIAKDKQLERFSATQHTHGLFTMVNIMGINSIKL